MSGITWMYMKCKFVAYRWSYQKGLHCWLGSLFCHSRSVYTLPGETWKQKTEAILNTGLPYACGYTNNYHSTIPKSIRGTSKFLTSISTAYMFLLRPLPTSIQPQALLASFEHNNTPVTPTLLSWTYTYDVMPKYHKNYSANQKFFSM